MSKLVYIDCIFYAFYMSIDELCRFRITLDYSKKNDNLHIDSNLKRNKTHRQGIHKLDSSLFEI